MFHSYVPFLVTYYYAKVLPRLASILEPLYRLLQAEVQWHWGNAQHAAFGEAKEKLTSSCLLTHYDPSKELYLSCNASPYGVGAVLSNRLADGSERPIAYASQTVAQAEKSILKLIKKDWR